MTFEFGVFLEFPRSHAQSDAEAFAQSFAQADATERLGLDAVAWIDLPACGPQAGRGDRKRHGLSRTHYRWGG